MRNAAISRKTTETAVELTLELDGTGQYAGQLDCGFLDHMLSLMIRHGRLNLQVSCQGDTRVDDHHTVEDVGITLGLAIKEALGAKRGITRYGSQLLPMDEALCMVAVDISGRAYLGFDVPLHARKVGSFDTELVKEFFLALTRAAEITLHIRKLAGENTHHIIEGVFKGFGRALRQAVAVEEAFADEIPSTKGSIGETKK